MTGKESTMEYAVQPMPIGEIVVRVAG